MINWTDDRLDARLSISWQTGISAGLKQAAEHLLMKAGEAWKDCRDVEAKIYRDLFQELLLKADAARKEKENLDKEYQRLHEFEEA